MDKASLVTRKAVIKQGMHVFADVVSLSDEVFILITPQQCWDSWISANSNEEEFGIATVKYKHTTNRSNMKYQAWNTAGL